MRLVRRRGPKLLLTTTRARLIHSLYTLEERNHTDCKQKCLFGHGPAFSFAGKRWGDETYKKDETHGNAGVTHRFPACEETESERTNGSDQTTHIIAE
jgi:hypothetical protein